MGTLREVSAEARQRIAAEREAQARGRVAASPAPRRPATAPRRPSRSSSGAPSSSARRWLVHVAETPGRRRPHDRRGVRATSRARSSGGSREAREEIEAEADRRIAAAEQRAADAEAAAAESHETAVRLETEIERRVMEGTEEVRREAEESVRKLVEKVEREAEEAARARAEDQLQVESDRIRIQAERREERAREATEEEIEASVKRARREAQAAAEETAPTWLRRESAASTAGYRTLLTSASHARGEDQGHAQRRAAAARPRRGGRDLRLRPDRLQPHPHRQRPPLRRLLAAAPASCAPRATRRSWSSTSPTSTTRSTAAAARGGGALGRVRGADDRAYIEDTDRLGLGRPDAEPLATETIDGIVALIADLVEAGHAYESGGDVYFRVAQLRRLRQALQPPPGGHGPGRGGGLGLAQGGAGSTSPSGRRPRRARTPAGTRPGAPAGPPGTSSAR